MNQYYNYKKWRLSKLNVDHHDALTPYRLLSSYPQGLYHPDISEGSEGSKVPITKEHVDNYPEQFGPHVLDMQEVSEGYINRLLNDLKYMGVTKEGSAFPHISFQGRGESVYNPSTNTFLPREHAHYSSTPAFPTYAGLVVYNALKHPSHDDFRSYIDQSEEDNPYHEREFADHLDMERNNGPFRNEDNIFYGNNIPRAENQPDDEYHNKMEMYRKLMGHIASRRYHDYDSERGMGLTEDSFADYLQKSPRYGEEHMLYDLMLDKLTSMARGDHLQ